MNNFIIYKATNKLNKKVYVGQTSRGLNIRIKEHLWKSNNPMTYFHKAISCYGSDNFTFEELSNCNTKEEADKPEVNYIDDLDSVNNGYNLTIGGGGSLGWKHSTYVKKQLSNNNSGKSFTDYMSNKNLELYKKKMSKITSGKGNGMYGNTGSKCKTSKKYIITTPEGEDILVHGLREFCREYTKVKLNHNYLSYCAKGKIKHYKGFKCKYL